MGQLPLELEQRIALLGSDRESGATDILRETLQILRDARAAAVPMKGVARALIRAQPSMAPVWNASIVAVAADTDAERFDRFVERVVRSPAALARFAVDCFAEGASPLRLVTLSLSHSVEIVCAAVQRHRVLRVACSESRPALEGRRLASRLASAGVAVTLFGDAAIAHALAAADAVLLGADAIGPEWFLNKTGSRMLAAAAAQQGIPVYVAATRDKFVGHAVGARLLIREGAPSEIWETPPAGVDVRNPYFESTPLDAVTAVISDLGVLGIGMIPDVCDATQDALTLQALEEIGR